MDEHGIYPWVIQHSHGKSIIMEVLQGKSSVNGPLSIAMLNNQRVFFLSWQNGDRRLPSHAAIHQVPPPFGHSGDASSRGSNGPTRPVTSRIKTYGGWLRNPAPPKGWLKP